MNVSPRNTEDWTLQEIQTFIDGVDDVNPRAPPDRLAFVMDARDIDRNIAIVIHIGGQWILAFDPRGSGRVSGRVQQLAQWLGRKFSWRNVPFHTWYKNNERMNGRSARWLLKDENRLYEIINRATTTATDQDRQQPWYSYNPPAGVRISNNHKITLGRWWSPEAIRSEDQLDRSFRRMKTNIDNWQRTNTNTDTLLVSAAGRRAARR